MLDSMPSYQRFSEREFFGSLNGLRAIAALLVVWHHCHQGIDFGRIGSRMGHVGVSLFFVLSGFLIVTLLIRERRKTADIDLRAFYGRRALRIMPLYYAIVILTAVFVLGFHSSSSEAEALRAGLPYLLTYTTNWVPVVSFLAISWTLATEEQFYLFWPQIQKRVGDSIWVPGVLLVLSEAIRFRLLDPVFHVLGWDVAKAPFLLIGGFTPILLGVLLAYALNSPTGFSRCARVFGYRFAPLVVVVILILALLLLPGGWASFRTAQDALVNLTLYVLLTLVIGATVIREDHALARGLSIRWVSWLGVISYGIYLLHLPVNLFVDFVLPDLSPVVRLLTITAFTLLAADLSYRFFERPFLQMKEKFGISRV